MSRKGIPVHKYAMNRTIQAKAIIAGVLLLLPAVFGHADSPLTVRHLASEQNIITLNVQKRFLLLPIQDNAPEGRVTIVIGNRQAGTNDIAMNNGFIALENVLGNLISMCELAKANRIRPILCSVTPSAGFGWRPEIKDAASRIEKLNGMIKAYAESEKIPYVDYHSALKDENGGLPATYSGDGVHPNLDCYKIMEKIILEYL